VESTVFLTPFRFERDLMPILPAFELVRISLGRSVVVQPENFGIAQLNWASRLQTGVSPP
jgi:hypothetical protein